jgi:hypothetical protein
MQQRRPRLGDILDDYCPRERRITNHAVVAMIEDDVRQTRCTTCDAEHEYKQAKVPASRRKKGGDPLSALVPADAPPDATALFADDGEELPVDAASDLEASPDDSPAGQDVHAADDDQDGSHGSDDDGPVHRPLIRATLPRPEGQVPERKAPDFTMRQPNRFDQQRNGGRPRGRPGGRQTGQSFGQGGSPRQGGSARQGSGQPGQGDASRGVRNGNRGGNAPPGGRGGRPAGTDRAGRPGGQGRKRGR